MHLYFFVKYSRYYARLHRNERVLKNAKLSTIAPLIIMIYTFIFCCQNACIGIGHSYLGRQEKEDTHAKSGMLYEA